MEEATPPQETSAQDQPPRKRRRWIRWALLGAGVVVCLVVISLSIIYIKLPDIVKSVMESSGSEALGQPVTVNNVELSLFDGVAVVSGVAVGNPAGFASDDILEFQEFSASVSLGSLTSDPLVINSLVLKGARANLQVTEDGKQNLRELLRPLLEKEEGGDESDEETPMPESGEEAEEPRSILLIELVLEDLQMEVTDSYATDETISTAATLERLTANHLILVPGNAAADSADATLTIEGLILTAPKDFEESEILNLGSLDLSIQLSRVFSTIERPYVFFPHLTVSDLRFVAERESDDDDTSQNLQHALVAILNATSMGDPAKLEEFLAEDPEDEDNAQTTEMEENEEKKGLFGKVADTASSVGGGIKSAATSAGEALVPGKGEEEQEPVAAEEELSFEQIAIDELTFSGIQIVQVTREDNKRFEAKIDATGTRIRYPQGEEMDSHLEVTTSGTLNGDAWKGDLTADGAIADTALNGPMTANATIEDFPLQELGIIASGTATGQTELDLKQGLLSGELKVKLDDIKYKKSDNRLLKALEQLDGLALPKITFEDLPVTEMSPQELISYFIRRLLSAAVGAFSQVEVPSELTEGLDAAGTEAIDQIKRAQEKTGETLDKVGESGEKAADSVKDTVKGLFGSKKKDE